MKKISEMTDTRFDGVATGYVPPRELKISDKLALHATWDEDVDQIGRASCRERE